MTTSIAIYIEGGGDTAQTLTPFRTGMSSTTPCVRQLATPLRASTGRFVTARSFSRKWTRPR